MNRASYGITRNLGRITMDDAVERVTAALKTEGFGVLTEIDVKSTLKQKLDVAFRPYKIFGACNPPLAHQALTEEPLVGLLLPCNVVVYEENDQTITVSAINPREMFKVIENPKMAGVAETVEVKLKKAMAALG